MIKVNGVAREYVNALSCGPGCTPHTYELRGGGLVRETPVGWILEHRGQGSWVPELSGYAIRLASVEVTS